MKSRCSFITVIQNPVPNLKKGAVIRLKVGGNSLGANYRPPWGEFSPTSLANSRPPPWRIPARAPRVARRRPAWPAGESPVKVKSPAFATKPAAPCRCGELSTSRAWPRQPRRRPTGPAGRLRGAFPSPPQWCPVSPPTRRTREAGAARLRLTASLLEVSSWPVQWVTGPSAVLPVVSGGASRI